MGVLTAHGELGLAPLMRALENLIAEQVRRMEQTVVIRGAGLEAAVAMVRTATATASSMMRSTPC
jgi:hypothetical protein